MNKKGSLRKTAVSIVESILGLVLMAIIIWWTISSLIFMISTKIGQWYNYTFLIVMCILCLIVGIVIGKDLLIFVFKQRQGGLPKKES